MAKSPRKSREPLQIHSPPTEPHTREQRGWDYRSWSSPDGGGAGKASCRHREFRGLDREATGSGGKRTSNCEAREMRLTLAQSSLSQCQDESLWGRGRGRTARRHLVVPAFRVSARRGCFRRNDESPRGGGTAAGSPGGAPAQSTTAQRRAEASGVLPRDVPADLKTLALL